MLVNIIFVIPPILLTIFVVLTPIRIIAIVLVVRVLLVNQGVSVLVRLNQRLNICRLFALLECRVIWILLNLLDPHQQGVQEV